MFGISEILRSRFLTDFSGLELDRFSRHSVDIGIHFHRDGSVFQQHMFKNCLLAQQQKQCYIKFGNNLLELRLVYKEAFA